jgi:hypothetical protein
LGQAHLVYQINLADVIGISTTYEELWFRQTLGFTVLTSYNDNMLIRVTRLFGGVPALAAIFAGSIGDDAFAALPTLYRTVDAVRAGREPLR